MYEHTYMYRKKFRKLINYLKKIDTNNVTYLSITNVAEYLYNNSYTSNMLLEYILLNKNTDSNIDVLNNYKFVILFNKYKKNIKHEKFLIFFNLNYIFFRYKVCLNNLEYI